MSKKVKEVPIQVVSFGLNLDPYMKGWITKVEEFRQVVEKNGVACASWSCEGRTRHEMHSRQLAAALPQFDFDIRYASYHCVARKKEQK